MRDCKLGLLIWFFFSLSVSIIIYLIFCLSIFITITTISGWSNSSLLYCRYHYHHQPEASIADHRRTPQTWQPVATQLFISHRRFIALLFYNTSKQLTVFLVSIFFINFNEYHRYFFYISGSKEFKPKTSHYHQTNKHSKILNVQKITATFRAFYIRILSSVKCIFSQGSVERVPALSRGFLLSASRSEILEIFFFIYSRFFASPALIFISKLPA